MYRYLIFDADHTLIDFDTDEKSAFERTFSHFNAAYTEADIHRAWVLSYTVWAEHGLNDIHTEKIQKTFHEEYVNHLPDLFSRIKAELYIPASEAELTRRFLTELNAQSKVLGNALSYIKTLAEKYKICIATNGLYEMQSSRLQEFLPHTHAFFVSETLGIIKPNRAFFTGMLTALQAKADECLFIGDSLTSDVAGANTVGMDCVWFNPKAKELPEGYTVKGQIEKIEDLQKYL